MALYRALLPLFIYVCRSALGQSVVEVEVGAPSVTLNGTVRRLGNDPSVRWSRGSEEVHLRDEEDDDFRKQNPLFKDRTQMNPDALERGDVSLELKGPTLTDSGTYTCVVREDIKEVDRFTVELRVKGLKVDVTEGSSSVSLPFTLMRTLGSEVSVKWTFGSEEVHLRRGGADDFSAQSGQFKGRTQMKPDALQRGDLSLKLKDLTLSDSGPYTCVVTEGSTELARTTVHLTVQPSLKVTVTEGLSSISLPFSLMRTLESEVSVKWTFGSEEVHLRRGGADDFSAQSGQFKGRTQMKPDALQRGDLSLELKDLTLSDSGHYTCVVTEGSTELARTTVHLTVEPRPVIIIILIIISILLILILFLLPVLLPVVLCLTHKRKKETHEPDSKPVIILIIIIIIELPLLLLLLIVLLISVIILMKKQTHDPALVSLIIITLLPLLLLLLLVLLLVVLFLTHKRKKETHESWTEALKGTVTCRPHPSTGPLGGDKLSDAEEDRSLQG